MARRPHHSTIPMLHYSKLNGICHENVQKDELPGIRDSPVPGAGADCAGQLRVEGKDHHRDDEYPDTFHYRRDGIFMLSARSINLSKEFKPENL